MRRLMQRPIVLKALGSGIVVTAAAVPYVYAAGGSPDLLRLRLACLFPVSVVLWQTVYAWSVPFPRQDVRRSTLLPGKSDASMIGAAALLSAVLFMAFLDPVLRAWMPREIPSSPASWVRQWLWSIGFQNLVFDAGVFAFVIRLGHRRIPAIMGVVVARALATWAMLPPSIPPTQIMLLLAAATLSGMLHGTAYAVAGFPGTTFVTTILHARLLPPLIF